MALGHSPAQLGRVQPPGEPGGQYLAADEGGDGLQCCGHQGDELLGVLPVHLAVELGQPVSIGLQGCQGLGVPGDSRGHSEHRKGIQQWCFRQSWQQGL